MRNVKSTVQDHSEFYSLAAMLPDIIYRISPDGIFTYLNPAIRTLGYEPDELIGKHFSEIIFPADIESVSREHVLPRYAGKITGYERSPKLFDERRSAARKTSRLEIRLVPKDKSAKRDGIMESIGEDYIIAEVNSAGLYQIGTDTDDTVFIGTVGVIRDVSDQRWMEAELIKYSEHLEEMVAERTDALTKANKQLQQTITKLQESENLSTSILEHSPIGMYIVQDNVFKYVNATFANTIEYTRERLIGENPLTLVVPEDRKYVKLHAIEMLKKGISSAYEFRVSNRAGETKWVMETVASIHYQGKQATLGNFMDITARKQAEEQLRKTLEGITLALAKTVDLRDPYTAGHQLRVAQLAKAIAEEMGFSELLTSQIYTAGLIHDIGKISIPVEILSKPGSLGNLEYSLLKEHPKESYKILENINFSYPIARWVLEHHELLDGSGYPKGLKGDDISIESRILTVADVVEAISSDRPYRASLGTEEALKEIQKNKNRLYDGNVVDACLRLFNEKGFKFT